MQLLFAPLLHFVGWEGSPAGILGDAAGCWEEPLVPTASFLICLWAQCPSRPRQHQLQLLKLLPYDHDQGLLLGRDAGRDACSRLQTGTTERTKMHPGTCMAEPWEAERRGHLKGCRATEARSARAHITASQNAASAVRDSQRTC